MRIGQLVWVTTERLNFDGFVQYLVIVDKHINFSHIDSTTLFADEEINKVASGASGMNVCDSEISNRTG